MKLESQLEGVLFYRSEPVKKAFLSRFLDVNAEALDEALERLSESLSERGLRITQTDTSVQLVTAPEISDQIEKLRKEELQKEIGKAGSETLAIILYRGPLTRAEIDRIRGVNSTFVVRTLLMRGLVERRPNPSDSRSFLYAITPALLQHLGIERREEMPDYEEVANALDQFEYEQVGEQTERDNQLTP